MHASSYKFESLSRFTCQLLSSNIGRGARGAAAPRTLVREVGGAASFTVKKPTIAETCNAKTQFPLFSFPLFQ